MMTTMMVCNRHQYDMWDNYACPVCGLRSEYWYTEGVPILSDDPSGGFRLKYGCSDRCSEWNTYEEDRIKSLMP